MVLADILAWLLIGAVAGLVFNLMVSGTGLGLGGDIVIGTAGALIGGFVTLLFIPSPSGYTTFSVTSVLGTRAKLTYKECCNRRPPLIATSR